LLEPNQQFLKVRYVTQQNRSFDSFIFGSSRVGFIDVKMIKAPGRWYNMTYSEGLPQEHVRNIEYMLNSGLKIKHLLVGLDEFSYTIDPKVHAEQWSKKPFGPVYGEPEWLCYLKYLFRHPDLQVLRSYYNEFRNARTAEQAGKTRFFGNYDFYATGQINNQDPDDVINANPDKHARDQKFSVPYRTPYTEELDLRQDLLESIKKLVVLAKTNGINLTVFINPIHKTTYLATNQERFLAFKRELSRITDYYDFSGITSITVNNLNYRETSHFRHFVGQMMIDRMIYQPGSNSNKFGVFVTADSVAQHLVEQQREILHFRQLSNNVNTGS
jgi:hypothetical protein